MHRLDQQPGEARHELDRVFEQRLDAALEAVPCPIIPVDFATRVASLVPANAQLHGPSPRLRWLWSRSSIFASAVALMLAILVLAPHAVAGANLAIALEWILCAQLSLLALSVALPGSPWRLAR